MMDAAPAPIKRLECDILVVGQHEPKTFLKDWERLSRSGRYDLNRLKEAMLLLIADNAPGPEWLDHPLKGDWADHRECHIGGDFLLIYQLEGNTAVLVRAGTHLFEE